MMIYALLINGISHKFCKQCGYESTSSDKMLQHLTEHQNAEKSELMKQTFKYERVKRTVNNT